MSFENKKSSGLGKISNDHKTVVQGKLTRVVESQEQIATNQLVDNLEEQKQLEELLEKSKPKLPSKPNDLHYLLSTPFRYPLESYLVNGEFPTPAI
ncbi:MAG: hypothetical protein L3J01_04110 [Thiomicrorhabdus sp.]|nr:hypothetical protein [Thiomicrorhabdus sp.]